MWFNESKSLQASSRVQSSCNARLVIHYFLDSQDNLISELR